MKVCAKEAIYCFNGEFVLNFVKLDLKYRDVFKKYTYGYINQEASFANLMMWNGVYYDGHLAECCDTMVINFANLNGKNRFSMPYGEKQNILCAVGQMCDYCNSLGMDYSLIDGNEEFCKLVEESGLFDMNYKQNRDFQEYVYSSEKLANLSGKELHSKKNHVNKFRSLYNYKFDEMSLSDTKKCLQLAEKWLDVKYEGNKTAYNMELTSIVTALENFEYFNLFGGVLYVDDEIVAFTVGEERSADTALIHIEKADMNYKGVFAAINCEFANMLAPKYKYLNREEDMGIEGLRKAKLSYRPEFFTDKYRCTIRRK